MECHFVFLLDDRIYSKNTENGRSNSMWLGLFWISWFALNMVSA